MSNELPITETCNNRKAFIVKQGENGRLDAWLAREMGEGFSRNRIKSLIEHGAVRFDGVLATECKKKIQPGAVVEVMIPPPENPAPEPEAIALDICYEDDALIVIHKPAGLVVHPGAGNGSGTLVNALLYHCGPSLSGIGGVKRPGIVHRLDKDTSGIMVVAKNDHAHQVLSEQFADHGRTGVLERAYLALHWGTPIPNKGKIDTFLGRGSDRLKRAVCAPSQPDAKHAITHYRVRDKYHHKDDGTALCALTECRLETGRTHQIRVHMAHIGHPLLGDDTYGAAFKSKVNALPSEIKEKVKNFKRQALHAYLLQFKHPKTGEIMRFEADMPKDMTDLIAAIAG